MAEELILIGHVGREYILFDTLQWEPIILKSYECTKMIKNGATIVGLSCRGNNSAQANQHFFKNKGILGDSNQEEVFTVIRRILHMKYKNYIICNQMGKTSTITEEELNTMFENGAKINGAKKRKTGIIIASGIKTIMAE